MPYYPVPPRFHGGTERVIALLAEQLAMSGHDVRLYASAESTCSVPLRSGIEAAQWPPHQRRGEAHLRFAFSDIIRQGDIDIIHIHDPLALAFAREVRSAVVYTSHFPESPEVIKRLCAATEPPISVVAPSARHADGMSPVAPRVVHHGLDPGAFSITTGKRRYAAFLGRFAPAKGAHVAIEAARRAAVPIRVAGSNVSEGYRSYVETALKPRFAERGVEWLGELDDVSKAALLRNAIALLFPIAWEEPFGLVMIEAMLSGTPVVAFPRGAVEEIVEPGVTGWIAEDCQEMAIMLQRLANGDLQIDPARCRQHAIERFSASAMAAKYDAVYRASMAKSHPRIVSQADTGEPHG